jgi:hypothetical protein
VAELKAGTGSHWARPLPTICPRTLMLNISAQHAETIEAALRTQGTEMESRLDDCFLRLFEAQPVSSRGWRAEWTAGMQKSAVSWRQ